MAATAPTSQQLYQQSAEDILAQFAAECKRKQEVAAQTRVDSLVELLKAQQDLESILGDFASQSVGALPVSSDGMDLESFASHPETKKETSRKRNRRGDYRAGYDVEQLQDCFARVVAGAPLGDTAAAMGVPAQTVADARDRGFVVRKLGGKPHLLPEDEERLMKWIVASSRCGMIRPLQSILEGAGRIAAKRGIPFKNGTPTDKWWRGFKQRALASGCACGLTRFADWCVVADVLKATSLQVCDPAQLKDATTANVFGFFKLLSNEAGTYGIPAMDWYAVRVVAVILILCATLQGTAWTKPVSRG